MGMTSRGLGVNDCGSSCFGYSASKAEVVKVVTPTLNTVSNVVGYRQEKGKCVRESDGFFDPNLYSYHG